MTNEILYELSFNCDGWLLSAYNQSDGYIDTVDACTFDNTAKLSQWQNDYQITLPPLLSLSDDELATRMRKKCSWNIDECTELIRRACSIEPKVLFDWHTYSTQEEFEEVLFWAAKILDVRIYNAFIPD